MSQSHIETHSISVSGKLISDVSSFTGSKDERV